MKNATLGATRAARYSNQQVVTTCPVDISRTPAPTQARHLSLPIVVDRFWRNRRGEAVVTQIKKLEDRLLVDVRVFYTDSSGKLQPSPKGVAVAMSRLPDLAKAINKAHLRARQLGLLGRNPDGVQ